MNIKKFLIYLLRDIRFKTFRRKKLQRIINFYRSNFSKFIIKDASSVIILDPSTTPHWVIANSYFVNALAVDKCATIKTYSKERQVGHPAVEAIFKSFNVTGHVQTLITDSKISKECFDIYQNIRNTTMSKDELFHLCVNDIPIGVEIYETYLRRGKSTVDFEDGLLWDIVNDAIHLLYFWMDFFSKNEVSGVVLSHDCYNHMGILAKVAYKNNTPTYMPNALGVQRISKPHSLLGNRFKNYKKYFQNLTSDEKLDAIEWGKDRLNLRISGEIGVDKPDSTKSAFTEFRHSSAVIRKSNKIKVVITTHDFFDNPHQYGGMLFPDFYEYLNFLVLQSKELDYDWYIKTHPDASLETKIAVKEIVLDHSDIVLIPPETSWYQLTEEGLDFVLTCYGSVGHELPLLGVQVVNVSKNNPHIAYDFDWHTTTLDEYKDRLYDLPNLKKNVNLEDIYQFYYLNYCYTIVDDFIFDSFQRMMSDLTEQQQLSLDSYLYFIDNLTPKKHKEILFKMTSFIQSNKANYFIKGPEDELL